MAAYPDLTRNWKIAWDDRGHFREPHTNHEIGVGTLAVQGYIGDFHEPEIGDIEIADVSVATKGPAGRYGSILTSRKKASTRSSRRRAFPSGSTSRRCHARA